MEPDVTVAYALHLPVVKFKKLRLNARVPQYQTEGAAGMDLHACLACTNSAITIKPGERALIGSGIAIALPQGYEAQVRPRSGLALKHGITVLNAPGTIDEDYRGEIGATLINHSSEEFTVWDGDRIAQIVVAPVTRAELEEVQDLPSTARGAGGFGSTGVKSE